MLIFLISLDIWFQKNSHYISMELNVNCIYTTNEIKKFFGVSNDIWKKKRNNLLSHLSNYYEYEVRYNSNDRRKIEYFIIDKIADYEKPEKKKNERTVERDRVFEEGIINVISNDNIQTSANINRIMRIDIPFVRDNYTEGTSYEYTRIRMANYFGTKRNQGGTKGRIMNKVWCVLDKDNNVYIPLRKEIVNDFFLMLRDIKCSRNNIKEVADICSDFDNGLINESERNRILGNNNYQCYYNAKEKFKLKYGYYPICVPQYEFNAFSDIKEKENE